MHTIMKQKIEKENVEPIIQLEECRVKDILKNNIIFVIGVILLTYKAIFLNWILDFEMLAQTVYYSVLVSALIMSPVINKKNKFAYMYLNIVYMIFTFIIYANFLYYSYSSNFLSFYQIGNLKYAKDIGNGVLSIITIKSIFMFWTDNVLIAILSYISHKKTKPSEYKNSKIKIAFIIIILLLNIIVVRNRVNSNYESRIYNKSMIVQDISIYYYHYEDIKDYFSSIFIKEKVDEEKIKSAYENNLENKPTESQYTGVAKGKNVIIVQLESLNEYIIGKKVNGKEITPNLNNFFATNIYCSEMYNQGLGTTADSEFVMENSMYPLENGYVFQKYYDNNWLDIYTTLRNEGYYTSFMHPNDSTYWNREEVYKNGYNIDEYNDITKFPNIEKAAGFYSDEGFLEEAVSIMDSYEGNFCTTLVTVTTHIPFELTGISDLELKLTIGYDDILDYKDYIYKNYIVSCNFMDYAFGKFLQKLEETGLMEESILVVYGDHGAGFSCVEDIERLYNENGIEYTEFEDEIKDVHIPFGIKIPDINSSDTIERAMSKIDIKPTIIDLLGLKNNFGIGQTIFSSKDYSFVKGLGYITSNSYYINDKCYDRQGLEEIEVDEELLKKMEEEIYLSDTIIKNNLLKVNLTFQPIGDSH